ncbi:MAG: hypothetical protein AAFO02_23235, partial [Bacteroidota bacterium]
MINKYLTLLLVLSSLLIIKAQPVVNTNILFSPGDQATVNYVETVFSPGAAGADVEWDFSGLSSSYSIEWMAVTPEITAFQDSFPAATIAFFIPANDAPQILEDTYAFYRQDGNDFSYLGSTLSGDINGNIDTSFFTLNMDADHLYSFPLQFGDSSSDDIAGVNTINLQGNALVTFRTGTTTTEVDGYGTLHTPAGTFENVLRVKRTEDLSDDFSGIATTQEIVRYDWISPNHRYLLFHTEEIIIRDFLGNEQSRSTNTYYSTPEIINNVEQANTTLQSFRVYPNPASNLLQLDVPSALLTQVASLWIYNSQGQRIH